MLTLQERWRKSISIVKQKSFNLFWGDKLFIQMKKCQHLTIALSTGEDPDDKRVVVIDNLFGDVRVVDGKNVVKIQFKKRDTKVVSEINRILINDVDACNPSALHR